MTSLDDALATSFVLNPDEWVQLAYDRWLHLRSGHEIVGYVARQHYSKMQKRPTQNKAVSGGGGGGYASVTLIPGGGSAKITLKSLRSQSFFSG